MPDILIDMEKNHSSMFKVLKFIYLNLQIDLFMIAFALIFDFKQMVKRAKNGPKLEKNISVALPFSGTIHHMVFIYGTRVK